MHWTQVMFPRQTTARQTGLVAALVAMSGMACTDIVGLDAISFEPEAAAGGHQSPTGGSTAVAGHGGAGGSTSSPGGSGGTGGSGGASGITKEKMCDSVCSAAVACGPGAEWPPTYNDCYYYCIYEVEQKVCSVQQLAGLVQCISPHLDPNCDAYGFDGCVAPVGCITFDGPDDNEPQAYWRFEFNCLDDSDYGQDGNPTDIAYGPGVLGQAAGFNGTSTVIDVPNLRHDFWRIGAFAFWVNAQKYDAIILDANKATFGFRLGISATGKFFYRHADFSSSTYKTVQSDDTVVLGNWTFLVATWDYVTHNMQVFVNGNPSGPLVSNPNPYMVDKANIFQMGYGDVFQDPGGASGRFWGQLDEVRIYDDALSPLDVETLYQQEKPY